jgi:hypothetical protein
MRGRWCQGVLILMALAGCAASGPSSDLTAPARASSLPSPTPVTTTGSMPSSSSPVAGSQVAIHTHCGVLSVIIDGDLWLADPPLGDHNPPAGWGENQTLGSFNKKGSGRAVFVGVGGQRAEFRRAPAGATDPGAECS